MPPIWNDFERENALKVPENSTALLKQEKMRDATLEVLHSIAEDVSGGLVETVGVKSSFSIDDGRCSMRLELPAGADTELLARAIDAENVEAWLDAERQARVAINPWYSTKDVDQSVLCTIKVIHVLLGIHATDRMPPQTLKQKLLSSIADIMHIQTNTEKKKN